MATFIKITREGSELLRRNTEETQASRLSKAEQDERTRTKERAKEERRKALARQGLDTSGNFPGDARRKRFRPDEPAASLIPQTQLAHVWVFTSLSASEDSLISIVSSGDGRQALRRELATGFRNDLFSDQTGLVVDTFSFSYSVSINRYQWNQSNDTAFSQYALASHINCYNISQDYSLAQTASYTRSHSYSVTVDRSYEPAIAVDERFLLLPAGGSACVLIYLWRSDWYYLFTDVSPAFNALVSIQSGNAGTAHGSLAFSVSNSGCRQLTVSSITQQYIDALWPSSTLEQTNVTLTTLNWRFTAVSGSSGCPPGLPNVVGPEPQFWGQNSLANIFSGGLGTFQPSAYGGWTPWSWTDIEYYFQNQTFSYSTYTSPQVPSFEPLKYVGLKAANPVTPSIYASLNQVLGFAPDEEIKQLPAFRRWLIEDSTSGPALLRYATYSKPGDPDVVTDGDNLTVQRLTFALSSSLDSDFPGIESEDYTITRFTAWDWDDPGYCRRMLALLGFTAADLRP